MKKSTSDILAVEHGEKITNHIRNIIENSTGCISFARFMELALYTPEIGYYRTKTYRVSDDITPIPEISSLFTQCMANQCQQILKTMPGDILEIGGGNGLFARDLLFRLEEYECMPKHYFILEGNPYLRESQKEFLKINYADLFTRIIWLETLPTSFSGIIIANEVMNTMPVHCFRIESQGIIERCVTWRNNQFAWELHKPAIELEKKLYNYTRTFSLPIGYESEINSMLSSWISSLSDSLKRGVILLSDYGYDRKEYYQPNRLQGTLRCHFHHHPHDNPFLHVGLQRIISDVDFTTVAESGIPTHLTLAGYTNLASFLLACGLFDLVADKELSPDDTNINKEAIQKLTLPSHMGEQVKVMALTKNFEVPLLGFTLSNRQDDL